MELVRLTISLTNVPIIIILWCSKLMSVQRFEFSRCTAPPSCSRNNYIIISGGRLIFLGLFSSEIKPRFWSIHKIWSNIYARLCYI